MHTYNYNTHFTYTLSWTTLTSGYMTLHPLKAPKDNEEALKRLKKVDRWHEEK